MEPVANWEERYKNEDTGWDIGMVSTPLKEYFDQLTDKTIKILIPGCGNGHEASYLHRHGFRNVFLLDLAPSPLDNFSTQHPDFPKDNLIKEKTISKEFLYNTIENKFKLKEYQIEVENNLISKIIEDINIYLKF